MVGSIAGGMDAGCSVKNINLKTAVIGKAGQAALIEYMLCL